MPGCTGYAAYRLLINTLDCASKSNRREPEPHSEFLVHGACLRLLCSPFQAARYHSLVIKRDTIPSDLEITAWTEDGTIMGVRHKKYPHIQGVQFHPESIITQNGKRIVANFLKTLQ